MKGDRLKKDLAKKVKGVEKDLKKKARGARKDLAKRAKGVEKELKEGMEKLSPRKKGAGRGKKVAAAAAGLAAAGAIGVVAARSRRPGKTLGLRVVPQGEDGWAVMMDGKERALGVFPHKRAAVSAGRKAARDAAPSRLDIHSQDGRILKSHSYES